MYIDWTKFSSLVARALADGADVDLPTIYWDCSGGCERPYIADIRFQPPHSAGMFQWSENLRKYRKNPGDVDFDENLNPVQPPPWWGFKHPVVDNGEMRFLQIATQCRKCETCRRNKSMHWTIRAQIEIARAPRTWFCTFTINPQSRFMFSLRAKSRDYHKSYGEISKEFTKMFKRLRRKGHKFRYLMVAEAHKDGYPHIHMLIHEVDHAIPKRVIQGEWPFGFSNVKLVADRAAAKYVTKYLAKDMRSRVRASQHYGEELDIISSSTQSACL